MISNIIFGFALALVVCVNVAVAWTTYALRRETLREVSSLDTRLSHFGKVLARLDNEHESTSKQVLDLRSQSPVMLGAQVAELSDAVERLRTTHQRFAGRFAQYVHDDARPDNSPPTLNRDQLRRDNADAIMPAGVRK